MGIKYSDESLVKSKSSINVNTAISEVIKYLKHIEQIEANINDVNDNLGKQKRRLLKELQEDQKLVIRKADKGSTIALMDEVITVNNSYET